MLAGLSPNVAFPAAIAAGALVACAVGTFVVRTTGAFFIMVTLAVAEMFYAWCFRNKAFNGADGMGGIPRLDLSALGIDLERSRHLRARRHRRPASRSGCCSS